MLNINENTKDLLEETLLEISNKYYHQGSSSGENLEKYIADIRHGLLNAVESGLNYNKQYEIEFDGEYKPEIDFGAVVVAKPNFIYHKIKLSKDLALYYTKLILLLTYLRKLDVLYRLTQGLPESIDYGAISTSSGSKGGKTAIRTNQLYYQHFPLAGYLRSTHSAVLFMPKQDSTYGLNAKEFHAKWYPDNTANPATEFDAIKHNLLGGLYPFSGIIAPQAVIYRKTLKHLFAKSNTNYNSYLAQILSSDPSLNKNTYLPIDFSQVTGFLAFKESKNPLVSTHEVYGDHLNNGIFNSKYGVPLSISSGLVINPSVFEYEQHSLPSGTKIYMGQLGQARVRLHKKPYANITPQFKVLRNIKYTIYDYLNNELDPTVTTQVSGFKTALNKTEQMLPYLNFIMWLLSGLKSIYPNRQGSKLTELGFGESEFNEGNIIDNDGASNFNQVNDRLLAGDFSVAPIIDSLFTLNSKHIPLNSAIQATITSTGAKYRNVSHNPLLYNEKSPVYTKETSPKIILANNIETRNIYHDTSYINHASFINNIHGLADIEEVGSMMNPYIEGNIGVYKIEQDANANISLLLDILKAQVLRLGSSGDRNPVINIFKPESISQILSIARLPYNLYKLYGNLFHGIKASIDRLATTNIETLKFFRSLKPYINKDLHLLKKSFSDHKKQDVNATIEGYTGRRRQDYINYTTGFYAGISKLGKSTPWPIDIDYQYGTVATSSGTPFSIFAYGVPQKLFDHALGVLTNKKVVGGFFKAPTIPGLQGPEPFMISYLGIGKRDNIKSIKIEGFEESISSIIDADAKNISSIYYTGGNIDIIAPNHFMRNFYTSEINILNDLGFDDIEDLNINNLVDYYTPEKLDKIANKLQDQLYIQTVAFDPVYSTLDNIINDDTYIANLAKLQQANNNIVLLNLLNNIMGNINRPVMPFSISGIIANLRQENAIKATIPELLNNSAKTIAGGISLPNTCGYILDGKINCLNKYIEDGYSEQQQNAVEEEQEELEEIGEVNGTVSNSGTESGNNSNSARQTIGIIVDPQSGMAREVQQNI